MSTPEIVHNTASSRFEVRVGADLAVLDYILSNGRIVFVHTGVPPVLEGRGIGSQLARAGLEYARREGLRVVPRCPFVRAYVKRHEKEYGALVHPA
jgi:predicted GNAT family acetyltransferase